MASVDAVMNEAYRFKGQAYYFGGEIPASMDPTGVGRLDCSELVEAATRRAGVGMPDGAYNQYIDSQNHGLVIDVDDARRTRGALLFYDDGTGTGRDRIVHVAFSEGDGRTFEAWQEGKPVGHYDANRSKFTSGSLIPGVDYGSSSPAPTPTPPSDDWDSGMRNLYVTSPHMKGDDVTACQILMRGRGFDPGDIDGVFGDQSANAVKGFQGSRGLTVDGNYGNASRKAANGG